MVWFFSHTVTHATQAEVAFIEAEAAVAAIKRRGYEVLPPLKQVCAELGMQDG